MKGICLIVVLALCFDVHGTTGHPKPKGNSWAPCAYAVEKIAAEGNGTTYGSCLQCNPTSFECPAKCQSLINALYKQCDGVYAPQDLYFDPMETLGGYWNDNMDVMRVNAARCGCSAAVRPELTKTTLIAVIIVVSLVSVLLL